MAGSFCIRTNFLQYTNLPHTSEATLDALRTQGRASEPWTKKQANDLDEEDEQPHEQQRIEQRAPALKPISN